MVRSAPDLCPDADVVVLVVIVDGSISPQVNRNKAKKGNKQSHANEKKKVLLLFFARTRLSVYSAKQPLRHRSLVIALD